MTITVDQPTKYVELADKRQREEAARIAQAAGGDSKLLVVPLEDRRKFKEDALRRAEAPLKRLSPQEVWKGTLSRVSAMRDEGIEGLQETLPQQISRNLELSDPTKTPIVAVSKSPHEALTLFAVVHGKGGIELQLYCGNVDGTVKIKKDGKPELTDIKPCTEETQNQPRYFATVAQRLPTGERNVSPQLAVATTTDINNVAKRLCQLFHQPEPEKPYIYKKDRQAVAPKSVAVNTATTARAVPAHQAHARSLWSKDREPNYDLTIAEQRAIRAAQMQSTPQPEPARYAYGM
ncbi:hypothetical protein HFO91_30675 [Rhizobium leguminosarum]|uniref:hypothetical protein n=1 Tax=Rhizobium leguminosarum TaxID=384 RepID=UPI001C946A04|nr:hypothetical protein [Rhizobium leguminosarum]MBY5453946.1 hypothetical protein [Rhizobium leguminosarum]